MRKVVTFIAQDGTEFDDETECLIYEDSFKLNFQGVKLFDKFVNPIHFDSDVLFDSPDTIFDTTYIQIIDANSAAECLKFIEHHWFCMPSLDELRSGDIWVDEYGNGEWINLTDRFNQDGRKIETIQSYTNTPTAESRNNEMNS